MGCVSIRSTPGHLFFLGNVTTTVERVLHDWSFNFICPKDTFLKTLLESFLDFFFSQFSFTTLVSQVFEVTFVWENLRFKRGPDGLMSITGFSSPNLPHIHYSTRTPLNSTQQPWPKASPLFFFFLALLSYSRRYRRHLVVFVPEHPRSANFALELEPGLNPFQHQWGKLEPVSGRRISSSSAPESLVLPLQCPSTGKLKERPLGSPDFG